MCTYVISAMLEVHSFNKKPNPYKEYNFCVIWCNLLLLAAMKLVLSLDSHEGIDHPPLLVFVLGLLFNVELTL